MTFFPGRENPPFLIAEIGSAHEGDFDQALAMVRAAAGAGADAVKFQTYRAEELVRTDLKAMGHVAERYEFQYQRFKDLEFAPEQYRDLHALCGELGVAFLSTPFDEASADMLAPLAPAFKVASGDLTHHRLLRHLAGLGKPVLLSTGMAEEVEIRSALDILGPERTVLLHCVAKYPTPDKEANLLTIPWLAETFGVPAGYSDHTLGVTACMGAAALGATVIEKHFTLDKTIPYGDHKLSAEPDDFRLLAREARRLALLRGQEGKPLPDAGMRAVIRRGAVAARDIPAGTALTEAHVRFVRPADGFAPDRAGEFYGRITRQAVAQGAVLAPDLFEEAD